MGTYQFHSTASSAYKYPATSINSHLAMIYHYTHLQSSTSTSIARLPVPAICLLQLKTSIGVPLLLYLQNQVSSNMVCPLCIAAAITANAPAIAAAFGGVAALKVGLGSRDGARRVSPPAYTTEEITCQKTGRVARLSKPVIAKAPKFGPMFYQPYGDELEY